MKPILTLSLLLLTLSLHAGTTVYSAPDETGLVGYWKMDTANVIDYSGFNNFGTNVNGITNAPGIVGSAMSFANASQHIAINGAGSLNVVGTGLTITAWIRRTTTNISNYPRIVEKCYGYPALQYSFAITPPQVANGEGRLLFDLYIGGALSTSQFGTNFISTNVWHFVCATYDGVNRKLYLDGVLDSNIAQTGNITSAGTQTWIGDYSALAGSDTFLGLIDEVRIYNRALSATEITNLYNFRQTTCLTNGATPFKQ